MNRQRITVNSDTTLQEKNVFIAIASRVPLNMRYNESPHSYFVRKPVYLLISIDFSVTKIRGTVPVFFWNSSFINYTIKTCVKSKHPAFILNKNYIAPPLVEKTLGVLPEWAEQMRREAPGGCLRYGTICPQCRQS